MSEHTFTAGRALYQRGRLVYPVGAPVPADAFPAHQTAQLVVNGGLRRAAPRAGPEPVKVPEVEADGTVVEPTAPKGARRARAATNAAEAPADGE